MEAYIIDKHMYYIADEIRYNHKSATAIRTLLAFMLQQVLFGMYGEFVVVMQADRHTDTCDMHARLRLKCGHVLILLITLIVFSNTFDDRYVNNSHAQLYIAVT